MSDNAVEYKSENPNGGRIYQARMLEPYKTRNIDFELNLVRNFDKDTADSVVKQVEEARQPITFDTYIIIDMITPSKHIIIIMNKETDKEINRYTLTVNKYGKPCMN